MSNTEFELDVYADENAPAARFVSTVYMLKIPYPRSNVIPTNIQPFVYVEVDEYGMVNIQSHRTVWFGARPDTHNRITHSIYKEIYEWLVEWEFAEWKRIGPEDSELFATEKLVGEETYRGFGHDDV